MGHDNVRKKELIEDILRKYSVKMSDLKRNRDKIITDFLMKLEEKKIEEIRDVLKKI